MASDAVSQELELSLLAILGDSYPKQPLPPAHENPKSPLIVGLDTNILKILRQPNNTLVSLLEDLTRAEQLHLVLPSQSVVEFWNHHETFTKAELQNSLAQAKKLGDLDGIPGLQEAAEQIVSLLQGEIKGADESPNEAFKRSRMIVDRLSAMACVSTVGRSRFLPVAQARMSCKIPPGFADADKASPFGDFFVWAEFLLGSMVLKQRHGWSEVRLALVTDDSKPDWRTAGFIHPFLEQESFAATGSRAELWRYSELQNHTATIGQS